MGAEYETNDYSRHLFIFVGELELIGNLLEVFLLLLRSMPSVIALAAAVVVGSHTRKPE